MLKVEVSQVCFLILLVVVIKEVIVFFDEQWDFFEFQNFVRKSAIVPFLTKSCCVQKLAGEVFKDMRKFTF